MKLPRISHSLGTALVLVGLIVLSGIAQTTAPRQSQATSGQTARKQAVQTLIKNQPASPTEDSRPASQETKASVTVEHSAATIASDPTSNTETTPTVPESADPVVVEPAAPIKTPAPSPDVCSCGGTLYRRCADCLPPQTPVCGVCGSQTDPPRGKQIMCPQYCQTAQ